MKSRTHHRHSLKFFDAFAAKQPLYIPGAVHRPEHFDSIFNGPIENQNPFKAANAKDAQSSEIRMFQFRIPSHFGLSGKECKCFVCGPKEAVTKFRAPFDRVIKGLVVEVLVGLPTMTYRVSLKGCRCA